MFFLQSHHLSTFLSVKFDPGYYNKFEKKLNINKLFF
jgi:hypothetical protein